MTEIIKRNVTKSKAGSGSVTYRLSMSKKMIEALGLTDDERAINVIVRDQEIILVKDKGDK